MRLAVLERVNSEVRLETTCEQTQKLQHCRMRFAVYSWVFDCFAFVVMLSFLKSGQVVGFKSRFHPRWVVSATTGATRAMSTADSTSAYKHLEVEKKWQRYWDENKTFVAKRRPGHPKKYVLDMFPYPSGAGLHVGHPEGYTATDIMARYWRMKDFDVLHPMGWDSFGLPAEQHAINTGTHPAKTTYENIATFKRQLKALGFSYDW